MALVIAAGTAASSSTAASGAAYIAYYPMQEKSGTVMNDTSGNGIHGKIGSNVVLGENTRDGSLAYRFRGTSGVYDAERLVLINNRPSINVGNGPFKVSWRIKTKGQYSNVSQKGQAGTAGGMWKLVIEKGWPRCHFEDGNGNRQAIGFFNSTNPATKVADGKWHTVSCERTSTGVKTTIDGISRWKKGPLGPIDNTYPLSLGGKWACNKDKVGCDYFSGAMDWFSIERP